MFIKRFYSRVFLAPAGDGGSAVDRGDDFTPTDDDDDVAAPAGKTDPAAEIVAKAEAAANGEGDEGAGDAGEAATAKPAAAKKGAIPHDRHEAILSKARERAEAAERELAELRKGQVQKQTTTALSQYDEKIAELEEAQAKHITDGDTDKAIAVGRQMRALERERNQIEGDTRTQQAVARATEAARYDEVMERVTAAYPELDADGDDFDEEKTHDVILLTRGYIAEGLPSHKALQKAVKKIMGAPETSRQAAAVTVTPKVDAEDVQKEAKKDLAAERKGAAIDKALATAKAQPAATGSVGKDSAGGVAKAVTGMSQEEFSKLSKDDRAKLRGDVMA